ncbi:MAG: hypothetical protein ACJLS2_06090 [Microcella pacifica]
MRISDRDPDALRVLDRLGVTLDELVTVADAQSPAGVTITRGSGSDFVVSASRRRRRLARDCTAVVNGAHHPAYPFRGGGRVARHLRHDVDSA